jgi:tryptophan synthase alpha chain
MSKPELMLHLVANYPSEEDFLEALEVMFQENVDYLEIQIPFIYPIADGPVIFEANQKALETRKTLPEIVEKVTETKNKFYPNSSTKLILMSYSTPVLNFGIQKTIDLIKENGFFGFIIPDLTIGSPEQLEFNKLCKASGLEFIPVVSPLTSDFRLKKITQNLTPNQVVYATARTGKTGEKSDLQSPELIEYLDRLKNSLNGFKPALGFGIKEKSQVDFLTEKGFISVIGSQVVRVLKSCEEENLGTKDQLRGFVKSLRN